MGPGGWTLEKPLDPLPAPAPRRFPPALLLGALEETEIAKGRSRGAGRPLGAGDPAYEGGGAPEREAPRGPALNRPLEDHDERSLPTPRNKSPPRP